MPEHRQEPIPELGGVCQRFAFDLGARGFKRGAHRSGGEFGIGVARRALPVAGDAVLLQFDQEVVLNSGGAMRNGERMAHRQIEIVQVQFHN